jgi:hypothetical protein
VLLCPGALVFFAATGGVKPAGSTSDYPYISMATTDALSVLISRFAENHTADVLQPSSGTTLTDMRRHPVVAFAGEG